MDSKILTGVGILGVVCIVLISGCIGSCGKKGESCCNNGVCDAGLTCKDNVCKNCWYEDVPYQVTETYVDKEPYQEQECDTVDAPYTEKYTAEQPLEYTVVSQLTEKSGTTTKATPYIVIRNDGSKGGNFEVKAIFDQDSILSGHIHQTKTMQYYIPAGGEHTFSFDFGFGISPWTCSFEVTPDTVSVEKERTNYKKEKKCEMVTKYRDVTKERTVTKYKKEQKCE